MKEKSVDLIPIDAIAPVELVPVNSKRKILEVAREQLPLAQLLETAEMLAKSTIVPLAYQNRPENCFIALDMASRMGASFMMVMQHLHIVRGTPSWSGTAVSALIRSSPQFKNVTLTYVGKEGTDSRGAFVSATRTTTGELLTGATVSIAISKKEGWYQKTGSKWQTMPDLMLAYRAYSWFGRVYAPELTLGLQSVDEVQDVVSLISEVVDPFKAGDK